jgi:hypothetical protein
VLGNVPVRNSIATSYHKKELFGTLSHKLSISEDALHGQVGQKEKSKIMQKNLIFLYTHM